MLVQPCCKCASGEGIAVGKGIRPPQRRWIDVRSEHHDCLWLCARVWMCRVPRFKWSRKQPRERFPRYKKEADQAQCRQPCRPVVAEAEKAYRGEQKKNKRQRLIVRHRP